VVQRARPAGGPAAHAVSPTYRTRRPHPLLIASSQGVSASWSSTPGERALKCRVCFLCHWPLAASTHFQAAWDTSWFP